jgi:hypothetical protein
MVSRLSHWKETPFHIKISLFKVISSSSFKEKEEVQGKKDVHHNQSRDLPVREKKKVLRKVI